MFKMPSSKCQLTPQSMNCTRSYWIAKTNNATHSITPQYMVPHHMVPLQMATDYMMPYNMVAYHMVAQHIVQDHATLLLVTI